jgi:hypothetical protein
MGEAMVEVEKEVVVWVAEEREKGMMAVGKGLGWATTEGLTVAKTVTTMTRAAEAQTTTHSSRQRTQANSSCIRCAGSGMPSSRCCPSSKHLNRRQSWLS